MKSILPILTLGVFALTPLSHIHAQNNNNRNDNVTDQSSAPRFWEANLPGGQYMVSLARISSISMSTYHVKGMVVHEVDIETMGSALARFYAIEVAGESNGSNVASNLIDRAKDIGREAGEKAGVDPDTTVTKEYPITTHAKTVEFRVVDKADLKEIYKSVSKAWRENRGRKITIK
ncbi:hypothetical protein [Rubritalea tangerina]|uniref:DUF541 domain-containing protein n=1 Tax=Rubritalea tangerina TaxID=430798 RepID=A0ABW4ZBG4_9BACT